MDSTWKSLESPASGMRAARGWVVSESLVLLKEEVVRLGIFNFKNGRIVPTYERCSDGDLSTKQSSNYIKSVVHCTQQAAISTCMCQPFSPYTCIGRLEQCEFADASALEIMANFFVVSAPVSCFFKQTVDTVMAKTQTTIV